MVISSTRAVTVFTALLMALATTAFAQQETPGSRSDITEKKPPVYGYNPANSSTSDTYDYNPANSSTSDTYDYNPGFGDFPPRDIDEQLSGHNRNEAEKTAEKTAELKPNAMQVPPPQGPYGNTTRTRQPPATPYTNQRPVSGQRMAQPPQRRPVQGQPQRPVQAMPQRPVQGQPQRPIQAMPQRPVQGQPQRPLQAMPQRPVWGMPQQPVQAMPPRPAQPMPQQRPPAAMPRGGYAGGYPIRKPQSQSPPPRRYAYGQYGPRGPYVRHPYRKKKRSFGPFGDDFDFFDDDSDLPWDDIEFPWDDEDFGGERRFWGYRDTVDWFKPWDEDVMSDNWDDMINMPANSGEMPPGWYAPYVSMPNPVTVGDEVGRATRDLPDQSENWNFNP